MNLKLKAYCLAKDVKYLDVTKLTWFKVKLKLNVLLRMRLKIWASHERHNNNMREQNKIMGM